MTSRLPPLPPIMATRNRNSNLVLALLHRLPPGRFGHAFADGLKEFGIAMLFGIEPAVYLIAIACPGLDFAGREANDNPLITHHVSEAELERRIRRHLRLLGYPID